MNILFCGGGTAGHITPAIAIAEAFVKKHPNVKIAFIGRRNGQENTLITKENFELFTIEIEGLSRNLTLKNIKKIKNAFDAIKKAQEIINKFHPDIVIGTGGYVCWPVISAAKKMKIKTVLHESNAKLGLTSKLLCKKCDIFLLGSDFNYHKIKNSYYVGNPLRKSFKKIPMEEAKAVLGIPKNKKLIISVGGSIGAKKLNDNCMALMEEYSLKNNNIFHLHSVGHRYFEELKKTKPHLCNGIGGCKAVPFINDMATALSAADVVISRCGAMTLAEIAFCSAASILIPSPNVTGNHQVKNALSFKNKNAALMIEEKELSSDILIKNVNSILKDEKLRKSLQKNVNKLASFDSAEKTVELLDNKLLI